MKATVEEINSVQRRVKVTIPSEKVNEAFDSAYKKLQKKARIQGFRPGKAPLYLIKKIYGDNVSAEVGENLINHNLFAAINEHGVKPVAPPFVEAEKTPKIDDEYVFSAVVDVMPTVDLEDKYKGIEITCKKFEPAPTALDRELKRIARRQAKSSSLPPQSVAELGHLATISHEAWIDGQSLPDFNVSNVTVALGFEELFKDLEDAILGMQEGQTKEVKITLPPEYGSKELSGKTIDFKVVLNELKKLEVPAIDDDLAKDLNYDSLDQLKEKITVHLNKSAEEMSRRELEQKLLGHLLETVKFEVPPAIVDQVIDSMIADLGISKEDQKKAIKDDELRKSMRQEAKTKAQNTIILLEVIKKENLSVSDDEIKEHISQFTQETSGETQEQRNEKIERTFQSIKDRLRESLLFEKALDFVADVSKITYVTVPV